MCERLLRRGQAVEAQAWSSSSSATCARQTAAIQKPRSAFRSLIRGSLPSRHLPSFFSGRRLSCFTDPFLMVPPFANPAEFLPRVPHNHHQTMPKEFFFRVRFIGLALECLTGIVNADSRELAVVFPPKTFGELHNLLF